MSSAFCLMRHGFGVDSSGDSQHRREQQRKHSRFFSLCPLHVFACGLWPLRFALFWPEIGLWGIFRGFREKCGILFVAKTQRAMTLAMRESTNLRSTKISSPLVTDLNNPSMSAILPDSGMIGISPTRFAISSVRWILSKRQAKFANGTQQLLSFPSSPSSV